MVLVHRVVFPRDFPADFGFRTIRAEGCAELAPLELGGIQPVAEGRRAKVLRTVREAFASGADAATTVTMAIPGAFALVHGLDP